MRGDPTYTHVQFSGASSIHSCRDCRADQNGVKHKTSRTESARVAIHSRRPALDTHNTEVKIIDIETGADRLQFRQQPPLFEFGHTEGLHEVGGVFHLQVGRVLVEHQYLPPAPRQQHGYRRTGATGAHHDDIDHHSPLGGMRRLPAKPVLSA